MVLDFFQKLNQHWGQKMPFAVYRKPASNHFVGVFQKDILLHTISDFSEKGFAFVSFDATQKLIIPYENSDVYVQTAFQTNFYYPNNITEEVNVFEQQAFENLVEKGITAIKKGVFQKVVLSRKMQVSCEDIDLEKYFKKLTMLYPNAFCSIFFHPAIGLWLGATPEQLLQSNENNIKTVALAGTQLYVENESVVWEQKEKEEQQFVTDFIVNNLSGVAQAVTVSQPYTFQAGNLLHIKTDVEAVLNQEATIGQVIERLHPTPAVCGLPKTPAQVFILKEEGYSREFYSGFLGELNVDCRSGREKQSDLFVNLRCMQIKNTTAHLYIGCGITKESHPEKEFWETQNKSVTVRKIL